MALLLTPKTTKYGEAVFTQRFINPDSEMSTQGFVDFGAEKSGKAKYFCGFDFFDTQYSATNAAAKLIYDAAERCGAAIPKWQREDMNDVSKYGWPMRTSTLFKFPTKQQRDDWKQEVFEILGNPATIAKRA